MACGSCSGQLWNAADAATLVCSGCRGRSTQLSGDETLSEIREYAGTVPDAEESVNKCNLQHSGCEKMIFFLCLWYASCSLLLTTRLSLSWALFWPRRWLCASNLSFQLIATAIDHDLPTPVPVQRGGRSPNNEIALRISLSSIPF